MKSCIAFLLVALLALVSAGGENPIFPAIKSMTLVRTIENGKLFRVTANSTYAPVDLKVVHLYGSPQEMGYAHGRLLAREIEQFAGKNLPKFLVDELKKIDLSGLPQWLQDLIRKYAPDALPTVLQLVLGYVNKVQQPFVSRSPVMAYDEMNAIADGVCDEIGCDDREVMRNFIQNTNMFPDLVRMACSLFGSWGSANAPGQEGLIQMRALDFGAGPFPNASVIIVQHPTNGHPFISVSFPGFVGVVTGISDVIGLSEKAWMISGQGLQNGTYDGEGDVLVMRKMLQFSDNIDDAVRMGHEANRTWAIFLGAGQLNPSKETGKPIRVMAYRHTDLNDYDDETISKITNQPFLRDIAWVDKHPQPSKTLNLYDVLKNQYGNITIEWAVSNVPRLTGSGDVHFAFYDYARRDVYISTGVTDENMAYPKSGGGEARDRTVLKFSMDQLFGEPKPQMHECDERPF